MAAWSLIWGWGCVCFIWGKGIYSGGGGGPLLEKWIYYVGWGWGWGVDLFGKSGFIRWGWGWTSLEKVDLFGGGGGEWTSLGKVDLFGGGGGVDLFGKGYISCACPSRVYDTYSLFLDRKTFLNYYIIVFVLFYFTDKVDPCGSGGGGYSEAWV